MKKIFLTLTLIFVTACGSTTQTPTTTTPVPESTMYMETIEAIPTFTPLPGPCATPAPSELNDFIQRSITVADNGKTFVTHVTSRFWIYLDDRIYRLTDLLNAIPNGLIGYISNGSILGPQCYPVMFEAVKEGKGRLQIKDFQLEIVVDNNAPESPLPLP